MAKQRNKTKTKTNKKSIVQKSITNAFNCPAHAPNTPPAKTIKNKEKPPKVTTLSPSNHDSVPEYAPLTSDKIIDPPINVPPITHQQETQPNQDMDIDNPSYLLVAHKFKDLPVVEKPVATSFHLLKKT